MDACSSINHSRDARNVINGQRCEREQVEQHRRNNDRERWASRIPETATLDVAGARVYVINDRHALTIDPHAAGVSAVISGHSHRPAIEERDGVLFVNPGSAGPRRFTLPVATARLRVAQGAVSGEIVLLDV